jgi:polar amino acid transport system substrate-binding protein
MKKSISILLCLVLSFAMLAGCTPAETPAATPDATEAATEAETEVATEAETKAAAGERIKSEPNVPAEGDAIARIQAKGTLVIATESTYPPFQYLIVEDGETINAGLDVDWLRGFAESLGVELQVQEMAFDSIIPAIQSGTVDASASFTPEPERAEVVDFSELYYINDHKIIIRKGESADFPSIEAFNGGRLGAQKGTSQETLIMEELTEIEVLGLPKVTSLIQELINGNINGIMMDESVADTYVAAYPDQVEAASFVYENVDGGVAGVIAKDQPDLLAAMNAYIAASIADGTMEEMYQKNITAAIDQIVEAQE